MGTLQTGLRRYDGSGEENGSVRSLLIAGKCLYAGGNFRLAGSMAATNIAKWDGTNWFAVGEIDPGGAVSALAVNGPDLFAGVFDLSAGQGIASGLARWDSPFWSALGSGVQYEAMPAGAPTVHALAANGSELFVGGIFTRAGGVPSTNIALWHIPHALGTDRVARGLKVSWPATGTNFLLETSAVLEQTNWTTVPDQPVVADEELVVTNEVSGTNRFFRLRRR